MTKLEVPHAAWNALQYVQDERDDDAVRAIATPVVVAELRRMAFDAEAEWRGLTITELRHRADELEAGAR